MSAAAGAGGSQPYGAAAMMFNKPWMDVKAEYVEAGSQFHRVALDAPLTSEPNRENVMVTVRPTNFLSLTGGRNNYLSPVENTQTEVSSQVNSASGALRVLGTGLSATYYHSGFRGGHERRDSLHGGPQGLLTAAGELELHGEPAERRADHAIVCNQPDGEPDAAAGCERADQPFARGNYGIVRRRIAFEFCFGHGGVSDVLRSRAQLRAV